MESKIEQLIISKDFSYLRPYFYNYNYALRCDLSCEKNNEEYLSATKTRALEIYKILFPDGADAIIFNYWITDHSTAGEADKNRYDNPSERYESDTWLIDSEMEQLQFLLKYQGGYRHFVVKDLDTYDEPTDDDYCSTRRNRIVCYSDGKEFDYNDLIERQLNGVKGHEIGFVSFTNECIFSVYDDRGCDVVFANHEKMKEFYHILRPYFLEYDVEEMEKRYNE